MKLTHLQFEVLCFIEREYKDFSIDKLAGNLEVTIDTLNNIILELSKNEFVKSNGVDNYQLTQKGYEALEP